MTGATDLRGQVALVTGATRGIGRAIALRLAAEGIAIAVAGRDRARGDGVVAEIVAAGGTGLFLPLEVTDYADNEAAVAEAKARLGRLDIVVANAGIGTIGFVAEGDPADWRAMMEVNFLGTAHIIRAALPGMLAAGQGDIVAISSTAGLRGWPEWAGYCASKHAVTGFLECLGREMVGKGIRVASVNPGSVDTPYWDALNQDLARAGSAARQAMMAPQDIAEIVLLQLRLPRTVLIKQAITFPTNEWH